MSSFLSTFVTAYAREVGFTSAAVDEMPGRASYLVTLHDDVVDEHASFTVSARDLLGVNREAVMRRLAYEIDYVRRAVVRRVTGDYT